jgi:hypothetical protein
MSLRRAVVSLGLALGGRGPGAPAPALSGEHPLQVVTMGGRAQTQSAGGGEWTAATLRTELGPGAGARTQQGRLTLRTPSGQELRLAPFSRLVLLDTAAQDQPTAARLDAGTVWVAVLPGSPAREQLEMQTAAATVLVAGSGVEVTLGRDGSTLVRVYHGAATCSGPGSQRAWARTLADGQGLMIPAAASPGETRRFDRQKINAAWAKWNEDQDRAGGFGSKPPEK